MNYQKIHDDIIHRASKRKHLKEIHHKHHILPKCEGGKQKDEIISLTHKEHYIIHLLRYKITGITGNYKAYCMLKYGKLDSKSRHKFAKIGAKAYHTLFKNNNPEKYENNQRNAGIIGGKKALEKKAGFHGMSEIDKQIARNKGRKTLVENKIGMFSDEYRKQHRKNLQKKVLTPDGIFDSMTEASEYYGVSRGTITYRVHNKEGWNKL